MSWFEVTADDRHRSKERQKARDLKKSQWWLDKLNQGLCHYCQGKFPGAELTMDHVVPVARGGFSTKGNIVPACRACNASKKLATPVDQILSQLNGEG